MLDFLILILMSRYRYVSLDYYQFYTSVFDKLLYVFMLLTMDATLRAVTFRALFLSFSLHYLKSLNR